MDLGPSDLDILRNDTKQCKDYKIITKAAEYILIHIFETVCCQVLSRSQRDVLRQKPKLHVFINKYTSYNNVYVESRI